MVCYFNTIFFRRSPEFKINKVAVRVLDDLVRPLNQLELDDREYACLKAIVFFDPGKFIRSLNSLQVNNLY